MPMPEVEPRVVTEVLPAHRLTDEQLVAMYGVQKAAWEGAVKPELVPHVPTMMDTLEAFRESVRQPKVLVGARNKPRQRYGGLMQTAEGPKDGLYVALAYAGEGDEKEMVGYASSRLNVSWKAERPMKALVQKALRIMSVERNYLEINGWYTHPDYQKQGVGTETLAAVLRGRQPIRLLNPVRSVSGYLFPEVYKDPNARIVERAKNKGLAKTGEEPRAIFGPDQPATTQVRVEASRRMRKHGSAWNAFGVRRNLREQSA